MSQNTQSLPYAVVLLSSAQIDTKVIAISKQLAAEGSRFVLNESHFYPHMTLYMAQLSKGQLEKASDELQKIALQFSPLHLNTTKYAQDNEGMIEVQYERIPEVVALQQSVLVSINPLRDGLRKKNPLGYLLTEQRAKAQGEELSNLDQYGYDEVGNLFRPHITFTRFIDKERMFDTTVLPPITELSGLFPKIGLFLLGENGTCIEKIGEWSLGK
jgi:hypothetical protein